MATRSHVSTRVGLQALIDGIKKSFDPKMRLFIRAHQYLPRELISLIQTQLDAMRAVQSAEAKLKGARATRTATAKDVTPVVRALELYLRGAYGADSPKLLEFGVKPDKRRKMKAVTKVRAVEKARATRVARGTMGRKQRLKIKGVVDGSGNGSGNGSGT